MFKLPSFPSLESYNHELADFMELMCWVRGTSSKREVIAYLSKIEENDRNTGCNDDDDENSEMLDGVMIEIERRVNACGNGYPFTLERQGTVLRDHSDDQSHSSILYRYLLLSTRLNMTASKIHAGIDGTLLLEEVSAHAMKNYLGSSRARSLVFGTGAPGGFQGKINKLCSALQEGIGFRNLDTAPPQKNDDKLDAVAWVPFSDSSSGQVVIFCQCKTGSSWVDSIYQLQPHSFVTKWISGTIVVPPIRAFCLSEAIDRSRWNALGVDAGLIFDRCRIIDFCDELPSDLLQRIDRWTIAARNTVNIN
jgi:hypothetical protein